MPRPRTNDPSRVSDDPVCVTDPVREAELVVEFRGRMEYVAHNFRMGLRLNQSSKDFNDALAQFKRAVTRGTPPGLSGKHVHPVIEMAVSKQARDLARKRTGMDDAEVEGEDMRKASRKVAGLLQPVPNRPRTDVLHHHVEGLMALLHETSGKPVLTGRHRNSSYDPHFKPGISQIIPMFFRAIDPAITIGQLVTIVEKARRKYAGEWPEFSDFFPLYGARSDENGSLILQPGWQLEHFEPSIPTYFH